MRKELHGTGRQLAKDPRTTSQVTVSNVVNLATWHRTAGALQLRLQCKSVRSGMMTGLVRTTSSRLTLRSMELPLRALRLMKPLSMLSRLLTTTTLTTGGRTMTLA